MKAGETLGFIKLRPELGYSNCLIMAAVRCNPLPPHLYKA